jgi:Do/DeqQ family serine protease
VNRDGPVAAFLDAVRGVFWLVLVLSCGIVLGVGLVRWRDREPASAGRALETPGLTGGGHSHFAPVVERVLPGVVSIDVEKRFTHGDFMAEDEDSWGGLDPELRDQEFDIPSSGSGFVIDHQGHILTNDHVVRDAVQIDVHLADGTTRPARLVGRDPLSDIAVLEVEPHAALSTVPLGNSDDVQIGDWVIAIGNPLGMLEGSVTLGIVSGKGRSDIAIRGGSPSYQDFIQTDASINPGNSGGPLVNGDGEAVGINTAFNAPGNGIGFAISINMARRVAEELIRNGRVPRGFMGVHLVALSADLAQGWGLAGTSGVVISDVQVDTPASEAGLREGDIITHFDGQPVAHVSPFRLLVAQSEIGRSIPVEFLREGRPRQTRVRLTEREDPVPSIRETPTPAEARPPQKIEDLGLYLSPAPHRGPGVLVDSLRAEGPGYLSGVREGDVILQVGWTEVQSPEGLRREVDRQLEDRGVAVLWIQRAGTRAFLTIRPD